MKVAWTLGKKLLLFNSTGAAGAGPAPADYFNPVRGGTQLRPKFSDPSPAWAPLRLFIFDPALVGVAVPPWASPGGGEVSRG